MSPLDIYNKMIQYPMGNILFSKAVCFKAPYFKSIKPTVINYQEGMIEIKLPKRKAVTNHMGTIHAIAMCNLAELCAGLTIDSVLPKNWRWIPKGMTVSYLKKATTDLVGKAKKLKSEVGLGDNELIVEVFDKNGKIVFQANVNMYITEKES